MKIQLKHSLQLTLLIFATLMFTSAVAQDIITVTGAKGSGIIAGTITPAQARQEAINQAKVEALRKAGVTENLQSYQSLFKSEVDNDFTEFFSSDVQAELQGAVKDYTIVKEENKVDGSVFFIEVTIDATVILYDAKPDPTLIIIAHHVAGPSFHEPCFRIIRFYSNRCSKRIDCILISDQFKKSLTFQEIQLAIAS